jgi:hypothetical protein
MNVTRPGSYGVTKNPRYDAVKEPQNSKRDEVLKRMLRTKPQPNSKKLKVAQLDFANSKDSGADVRDTYKHGADISDRNEIATKRSDASGTECPKDDDET